MATIWGIEYATLLKIGACAFGVIVLIVYFVWKGKKGKSPKKVQGTVEPTPIKPLPVKKVSVIEPDVPELIEGAQVHYQSYSLRKCRECSYIGYGERFETHNCNNPYNDGEYTQYKLLKCKKCEYIGYGDDYANHKCISMRVGV
jgi:hypothetical protein